MLSRWLVVGVMLLGVAAAPVHAQFGPPPVGVPVLVPNGIGFSARGGNLRVAGFFSNGVYTPGVWFPYYGTTVYNPGFLYAPPYYLPLNSSIDYRINVTYVTPRVVLASTPPLTPAYDLSGVDLDLVPANKVVKADKQEVKLAKLDPPKAPQPAANLAKDLAKEPAKAPPVKEPELAAAREGALQRLELPPPKAEPFEEGQRLLELGKAAFREGQYGVAAQRFTQAAAVDTNTAQPQFHLAQAYFAQGKYQQAVQAIEQGLAKQPDWPQSAFQPRLDFYRGIEEEWRSHRQALEDACKRQPTHPTHVLLLAHQLWFDGQRGASLALFRRAKALVNNSAMADTFLKAGEPVAAR